MKRNNLLNGYFIVIITSYAIGMLLTMTFAFVYEVAQPALLYLVPSILLPILALGWHRGTLSELWNGTGMQQDDEEPKYTN